MIIYNIDGDHLKLDKGHGLMESPAINLNLKK